MSAFAQAAGIAAFEEVSLAQALQRCREARIALPVRLGACIGFDLAEGLLTRPVSFSANDVFLQSGGALWIDRRASACSPAMAAQHLRQLLLSLWVAAGPEPLQGLLDLVDAPAGGEPDLRQMRDALALRLAPFDLPTARLEVGGFAREVHMGSVVFALPRRSSVATQASTQEGQALDAQLDALLEAPAKPRRGASPLATLGYEAERSAVYVRRAAFSLEAADAAAAQAWVLPQAPSWRRLAVAFGIGLLLGVGSAGLLWLL